MVCLYQTVGQWCTWDQHPPSSTLKLKKNKKNKKKAIKLSNKHWNRTVWIYSVYSRGRDPIDKSIDPLKLHKEISNLIAIKGDKWQCLWWQLVQN